MSLELENLKGVRRKPDGPIVAQCPACAEAGGDRRREHLIVYPNGAYGCVASPGDQEHSRRIHQLAGNRNQVSVPRPIPIRIPGTGCRNGPPVVLERFRRKPEAVTE